MDSVLHLLSWFLNFIKCQKKYLQHPSCMLAYYKTVKIALGKIINAEYFEHVQSSILLSAF